MAAKKQTEIKLTVSDENVEQEAINERRSTSLTKRKSSRGKRNANLNILVPKSLREDFTLYAKASNTSMGDIINEYLEKLVSSPEGQRKIEAARAFYQAMNEDGKNEGPEDNRSEARGNTGPQRAQDRQGAGGGVRRVGEVGNKDLGGGGRG
jgi:hypothetical protein